MEEVINAEDFVDDPGQGVGPEDVARYQGQCISYKSVNA